MKTKKLSRNSLHLLLGGIAEVAMLSRETMLDGGPKKGTTQEKPEDTTRP